MGCVIESVAARQWALHGTHMGWEWNDYAERLDLRCVITNLPDWLPAYYYDRVIYLRRGMDAYEIAWWAWHEIGHYLMHPGNLLAPMGDYNLNKIERQADVFAATFPHWDIPGSFHWEHVAPLTKFCVESERRFIRSPWGGGV